MGKRGNRVHVTWRQAEDNKEKEGNHQVMGQGTKREAGERTNKNEIWTPHNETHYCVHQFIRNMVTLNFLLCIGFPNCCLLVQTEVMFSILQTCLFCLCTGRQEVSSSWFQFLETWWTWPCACTLHRSLTHLIKGTCKCVHFFFGENVFLSVFSSFASSRQHYKSTCNWLHLQSLGFTICGH